MIPFKFFKGKIYTDEYTLQEQPNPPFGISHRHWNMLPQDLRNGDPIRAEIYVAGWEACLSANLHVNPYMGFNDPIMIENREVWNQGYMACMNRRTRTYTERDMEYYHTEEFLFFDVTEVMDDPDQFGRPYKFMLFRHIEGGNTVEGNRITPEHPMWNFPDII